MRQRHSLRAPVLDPQGRHVLVPGRRHALQPFRHHEHVGAEIERQDRQVFQIEFLLLAPQRLARLAVELDLNLLDQVRPADLRALAEQVPAPALVIVGEQDVANRGPSTVLARSLPLGNLRVVPQAGAGWRAQQPQVVARLLVEFLSSLT